MSMAVLANQIQTGEKSTRNMANSNNIQQNFSVYFVK